MILIREKIRVYFFRAATVIICLIGFLPLMAARCFGQETGVGDDQMVVKFEPDQFTRLLNGPGEFEILWRWFKLTRWVVVDQDQSQ